MAEKKHLELTSSHRYTKLTTTYRGTNDEKDLKTRRKSFPQLKLSRRNYSEMGRRGRDTV